MKYNVLTSISILDIQDSADYDLIVEHLVNEQDLILSSNGYSYLEDYRIEFYNCEVTSDLNNSLQMLSLKEGADLVEFEDGSIGFVGYYSGISVERNYFKIIGLAEEMEQ